MSAYIVDNKTISAIAKGFEVYGVIYEAEDYINPMQVIYNAKGILNGIGQSLLNQNYKSVNYRYSENTKTPKFEYEDVEINEGILLGCIECYEYQACETSDYFESDIHESLSRLKNAMLQKMIKAKGQQIPWGYEI